MESESRSKISIYTALGANIIIALSKFVAAAFSKSSSMLAEGVHSLVDTTTELLLLWGIRKSKKAPDKNRPFGYGKEVYFWSFVVSILIFALGGGVSFFEGVMHIRHPVDMRPSAWNYSVLAIAFVFEIVSLITVMKQFNAVRGRIPFWKAVRDTRDASLIIVLFEELADVVGIMLAFAGVWLAYTLHAPYLDGIASLLIGLLLTVVSLLMLRESKSLLMGETAKPQILKDVIKMAEADEGVVKVRRQRSMVYGPDETILLMEIKFRDHIDSTQQLKVTERVKNHIRKVYPKFTRIFIESVK